MGDLGDLGDLHNREGGVYTFVFMAPVDAAIPFRSDELCLKVIA